MSDFRDDDVEHLLDTASGRTLDIDLAYAQVQRRVRTAQRRRAAAIGTTTCLALAGIAALTFARPSSERLQPAGRPASTNSRPPSSDAAIAPSTTTEGSVATEVVPVTTTTATDVTATSEITTNIATPPTTSAAVTQTQPPITPPTTSTASAATTADDGAPTDPATDTQTFIGIGGRITVRLADGSLVLVSYQAEAGFSTAVNHPSGSHVEVRFESATHVTDARVELEDGQMQKKFEESDD